MSDRTATASRIVSTSLARPHPIHGTVLAERVEVDRAAKRQANTEWARRARLKKWFGMAEALTHCPANLARGKPCRAELQNRKVDGVTVPFCPQCDRKRRGICIDCQRAPVEGTPGKSLRCLMCHKIARSETGRRFAKKHPARVRQKWQERKKRLLEAPGVWEARLERSRLWRLAHPKAVAASKVAWNRSDTARAYQRDYRARMAEERRQRERARDRARARGDMITHPCTSCQTALVGRQKKCAACRTQAVRTARAALIGAAA